MSAGLTALKSSQQGDETGIQRVIIVVQTHGVTVQSPAQQSQVSESQLRSTINTSQSEGVAYSKIKLYLSRAEYNFIF